MVITGEQFSVVIGRAGIVIAPLVTIVPIKVNTKGPVSIILSVLPPHATAVGVGVLIVYISVRVNHGNKIHLAIVYKVFHFSIAIVILEQVVHVQDLLLH